jgi:hypothetical protein
MAELLLLFIAVLLANILPFFTPPSWLLIFFLGFAPETFVLANLIASAAATLGQFALAKYSAILVKYFITQKQKRSIRTLKNFFGQENPLLSFIIAFFYTFSPLPTNILFIIAGVVETNLLIISVAFFLGTFISNYILLNIANHVMGITIANIFSFENIALGLMGLGIVIAFLFIDWDAVLKKLIEHERKRMTERLAKKHEERR